MLKQENQAQAEHRIEALISKLPRRMAAFIRWLRQPKLIWVRVPLGLLLICSGFLAILPFFGVWMTPLGIILLAQDIGPLRRGVYRLVNWTAGHRPEWFGEQPA